MTEPKEVSVEVVPAQTQALLARPVNEQLAVARPVVTPAQAKEILAEWEALKQAIARPEDIHEEERGGKKIRFYKKSFWRRAATFLNLSVNAVAGSERFDLFGQTRVASVAYEASVGNGRRVSGDGHCGNDERGKERWTTANLLATAHTRAYNRAVSNCIGGGEVSADELEVEEKVPRAVREAVVHENFRQKIDLVQNRDQCAELYKEIHVNARGLEQEVVDSLLQLCKVKAQTLAAQRGI